MKDKILLPLVLGLLFFNNLCLAQDDKLFFEGTAAYSQGQWKDAAAKFEQFLTDHPNDARSHLNLASIYAKQKDWGRSWAYLRKAKALDPHLAGLSTLQNLLEENPSPPGISGPFYSWARPVLAAASPSLLLALLFLTLTACGHFFIRSLRARKWAREAEETPPPFSLTSWICLGLSLVVVFFLAGRIALQSQVFASVIENQTPLYSAPTQDGFEVGALTSGTELKVLRQQVSWVQVTNDAGTSGWVAAKSVLIYRGAP